MTDEEIEELKEEGLKVAKLIDALADMDKLDIRKYHLVSGYRIIIFSEFLSEGSLTHLRVYSVQDGEKGMLLLDRHGLMLGDYHKGKWSQDILNDEVKIKEDKEDWEELWKKKRREAREALYSSVDY